MADSPDLVTDILAGTERPFTMEMADELGLTRRQVYGPRYRSVIRGVFIDGRIPDSLVVLAKAALLVAPPGGVLSHFTAACLWSASAPRSSFVHLAYPRHAQTLRKDLKLHRYTYRIEHGRRHGLPVTGPGMTFMHLAVHLDLVQLTAFGDQLVKRRVITVDELTAYALAWVHHGQRAGREAAALVRDRVDSVPESHLRLLLVLAGLPEPEVNHSITARDGTELFRLDLAYVAQKVAVEYDGRWHDTPEQRTKDRIRRRWLTQQGWRFVVVRAADLYEEPDLTLSAVCEALTRRGLPLSGRLSEEYRRYFGSVKLA